MLIKNSKVHPEDYISQMAQTFFSDESKYTPLLINRLARDIVSQNDVESEILEVISKKIESLVSDEKDKTEFKETLALIRFKQGRIHKAIDLQKEVLLHKNIPVYRDQLQYYENGLQNSFEHTIPTS